LQPASISVHALEPEGNALKAPSLRTQTDPYHDHAKDSSKLILSVDDEEPILYARKKILETAGYEVLSASDGELALGFFAAILMDLVILDYAMPGIDGGRVAREMKARKPMIPIILVTALPLEEAAVSSADCVVMKGEGPVLLLEKTRQLLAPPSAAPGQPKFNRRSDIPVWQSDRLWRITSK
jgi:CheY-like chemotaxis protein